MITEKGLHEFSALFIITLLLAGFTNTNVIAVAFSVGYVWCLCEVITYTAPAIVVPKSVTTPKPLPTYPREYVNLEYQFACDERIMRELAIQKYQRLGLTLVPNSNRDNQNESTCTRPSE